MVGAVEIPHFYCDRDTAPILDSGQNICTSNTATPYHAFYMFFNGVLQCDRELPHCQIKISNYKK